MPERRSAHSGVLADAVLRRRGGRPRSDRSRRSTARGTRDRSAPRPPGCARAPSITATSVPGTTGSHSASTNSGRSSRIGLSSTNSAPRAFIARRWSRRGCRLAPPGLTIVFLSGRPPKQTKQLRVALDHRPGRRPVEVAAHVADDVGHDHGQRPVAVAVLAADEAAEAVEEAMELALRVVEAARAGPAVGAPVDGLAAVLRRRRGGAPVRGGRSPSASSPARTARRRGARPVPGPRSSQPARIIGWAMRARWRRLAGMLPSSGEGSGSSR